MRPNGRGCQQKGFKYEREVVRQFLAAGLAARRFWGSDGRSAGKPEKADLEVLESLLFQNKRLKRLPVLLQIPEGIDGYICRQDQGTSVVVISLEFLITLLQGQHGTCDKAAQPAPLQPLHPAQDDAGIKQPGHRSVVNRSRPVVRHRQGDSVQAPVHRKEP